LFGVEAVRLNINGQTEYKTAFGGVASLILRGLLLWYFVLNAKKMIGKQDAALA
jgi:hypothetical protein